MTEAILITPYGVKHKETWHNNQELLHNLEVMVKETKCRKKRSCSFCRRNILPGELALKTTQRVDRRGYVYNAYCSDCYTKKVEQ